MKCSVVNFISLGLDLLLSCFLLQTEVKFLAVTVAALLELKVFKVRPLVILESFDSLCRIDQVVWPFLGLVFSQSWRDTGLEKRPPFVDLAPWGPVVGRATGPTYRAPSWVTSKGTLCPRR